MTRLAAIAAALAGTLALAAPAGASLQRISHDPYTNSSSQHATEVEPDTFADGSSLGVAFQVGRFYDGGASNIGFASTTDGGATWHNFFVLGLTVYQGGSYARASDASVAYDARHGVWLVTSLALADTPSVSGVAVVTSRLNQSQTSWSHPATVGSGSDVDKSWTGCDENSASPFFGHCYTEWDDNAAGNRIKMSTSTDGGVTWGPALQTADNATGLGGQPLVQPNGTVVVPIANADETAIRAFKSTNGGASWGSTVTVSAVSSHTVAGALRTSPLPSAEIDGSGRVYVAWQDCRFRAGCASNDIVMSSSADGSTWSTVARIPIDATTSAADHFIPGLAVDPSTSGSSAHLALTYYFYPSASCSTATCQLEVGYVSSTNAGASWSAPATLAGPMTLSWLPQTSQGNMVGDYMSTSFLGGRAYPVFAVAHAPSGSVFDQATYTVAGGLAATGGVDQASSAGAFGSPALSTGAARTAR